MIPGELKSIADKLNRQGKMCFLEGATEAQIALFEESNKVKLPQRYKEWLQFSDGGECFLPAGIQLYGVAHKPLIGVNDDNKPDEKYIAIGALSTGDPIFCEKDEETISIYNQDSGRIESDETYKDFFSFLNSLYELLGIGG